jgi:uncharacterized protein (DUF58 family)
MKGVQRDQQVMPGPGSIGRATSPTLPSDRVQPATRDLIALRHAAEGLSLGATRVRSLQGQNYLSAFKGRGMEFDESRPYTAGDDIRSLDWRVMARTGRPHTKLFREERERPVIVAVDYRPAMFFATQGSFKSVQAARCAALLAWRAAQQGDRLGGFIFSARDHWEGRPGLGSAATLHFLQQLATRGRIDRPPAEREANLEAYGRAVARLRRVARPGSLIVLISDFRNLDAGAEANLAQLSRHSELVMIFVYDPLEMQLPPAGQYRVADGDRQLLLDTRTQRARSDYAQRFQRRRNRIRQLCQRQRMIFLPCATNDDPLLRLQQGLRLRQP